MFDENAVLADVLIAMAARKLAMNPANPAYHNERYVKWLVREAGLSQTISQRRETFQEAEAFARRVSQKLTTERLSERIPALEFRQKMAPVVLPVRQATSVARNHRCAPMVDMAVAAGEGRIIWDEACDRWLELPEKTPAGRYVALQVTGDSMSPLLEARDVILIKLDSVPIEDDVIVARPGDDGYVVKRVAAVHAERFELASINPDYGRISMERDMSRVVGTVIARFRRIDSEV
jgi:SOS-response transcriptional repressor LexA